MVYVHFVSREQQLESLCNQLCHRWVSITYLSPENPRTRQWFPRRKVSEATSWDSWARHIYHGRLAQPLQQDLSCQSRLVQDQCHKLNAADEAMLEWQGERLCRVLIPPQSNKRTKKDSVTFTRRCSFSQVNRWLCIRYAHVYISMHTPHQRCYSNTQ